jgi:hypothetical protein
VFTARYGLGPYIKQIAFRQGQSTRRPSRGFAQRSLTSAIGFVFQFAIQKCKDQGVQNYKFACFLYGSETWSLPLREGTRAEGGEGDLVACGRK